LTNHCYKRTTGNVYIDAATTNKKELKMRVQLTQAKHIQNNTEGANNEQEKNKREKKR